MRRWSVAIHGYTDEFVNRGEDGVTSFEALFNIGSDSAVEALKIAHEKAERMGAYRLEVRSLTPVEDDL